MYAKQTNRKHKDRLIRFLFSTKTNLLSSYNAVNHSSYINEDELEIYTMEDYVYMGMKNDLSFLINWNLNIYEHQSSVNPNMPLRGLFYTSAAFQKYVSLNQLDLYSSKPFPLPVPMYIVFYNGEAERPEKEVINLTDLMTDEFATEKSCLEFKVTILNINQGYNQELKDNCPVLNEYSQYIAKIREYHKQGMDMSYAIDAATMYCIDHGILRDVLLANRSEVTDMLLTEYDETFHIENEKRISFEEGRQEERKNTQAALRRAEEAEKELAELRKLLLKQAD